MPIFWAELLLRPLYPVQHEAVSLHSAKVSLPEDLVYRPASLHSVVCLPLFLNHPVGVTVPGRPWVMKLDKMQPLQELRAVGETQSSVKTR